MKLRRSEEGASIAEFALVLPVLMLLLMVIFEGGRVFNAWMVLTNETHEAARYGIAGVRDGDANLVAEINAYAESRIGTVLDPSHLTLNTSVQTDGAYPAQVTVQAQYSVPIVTPLLQSLAPSVPISVESVMRAE